MNRAEKTRLRRQMEKLAKQHGKVLDEDLIAAVFWFMEEGERRGQYIEIVGATSGDDFFEFDLQTHKVQ